MNVTIRDKQALAAVRPLEVAAYLRASGWRLAGPAAGGRAAEWATDGPDGAGYELLLPADPSVGDYALRIADALRALEAVERRSQLDILSDLQTASADIVRVRVGAGDGDAADGSLPIDECVQVVHSARELMLAAASSAAGPRPRFQSRRPTPAVDYLRTVRMGQTERGSYVVTIHSPVAPALAVAEQHGLPGLAADAGDPFARRVTGTLARALAAARDAVAQAASTGDFAPFAAAVAAGVSANLCDAVAGLVARPAGGARPLDVGFSWSRTRPAGPDAPRGVRLGADAAPVLAEAARLLRAATPEPDYELFGPVVRLDRDDQAAAGTVVVAPAAGRPRRVTVRLAGPDYQRAVVAHANGTDVVCWGVLARDGRTYVLREPIGFHPWEPAADDAGPFGDDDIPF